MTGSGDAPHWKLNEAVQSFDGDPFSSLIDPTDSTEAGILPCAGSSTDRRGRRRCKARVGRSSDSRGTRDTRSDVCGATRTIDSEESSVASSSPGLGSGRYNYVITKGRFALYLDTVSYILESIVKHVNLNMM